MQDIHYCRYCERADVFSRGALVMSSQIARTEKPSLFLKLRNLTATDPLQKPLGFQEGEENDYFLIDVGIEDLRDIVFVLTNRLNTLSANIHYEEPQALPNVLILRTLIEDWLRFAQLKFEADTLNNRIAS